MGSFYDGKPKCIFFFLFHLDFYQNTCIMLTVPFVSDLINLTCISYSKSGGDFPKSVQFLWLLVYRQLFLSFSIQFDSNCMHHWKKHTKGNSIFSSSKKYDITLRSTFFFGNAKSTKYQYDDDAKLHLVVDSVGAIFLRFSPYFLTDTTSVRALLAKFFLSH